MNRILFTLTSYYPDMVADEQLLETILNSSAKEIYFFPQTKSDTEYLATLPIFKKNISRFKLLNHNISEIHELISTTDFNYIGNRLHCGIKCLAFNRPTIIISVDNRAVEMGKSINLNTAKRDDIPLINKWINAEYIPPQINLPLGDIEQWKKQFS